MRTALEVVAHPTNGHARIDDVRKELDPIDGWIVSSDDGRVGGHLPEEFGHDVAHRARPIKATAVHAANAIEFASHDPGCPRRSVEWSGRWLLPLRSRHYVVRRRAQRVAPLRHSAMSITSTADCQG